MLYNPNGEIKINFTALLLNIWILYNRYNVVRYKAQYMGEKYNQNIGYIGEIEDI